MEKVIEVLKRLNVDYRLENNEVVIDDIGGNIYELNGRIGFVYGNTEPSIEADNPMLPKWVEAYIGGCEMFGDFLRSLN